MTDAPGRDDPGHDHGPDDPGTPRKIEAGTVFVGVLSGALVMLAWLFTVADGAGPIGDVVVWTLALLPVGVAVLSLLLRRTRQIGAGFVMGMAIGTLLLFGVCGSIAVPPGG